MGLIVNFHLTVRVANRHTFLVFLSNAVLGIAATIATVPSFSAFTYALSIDVPWEVPEHAVVFGHR